MSTTTGLTSKKKYGKYCANLNQDKMLYLCLGKTIIRCLLKPLRRLMLYTSQVEGINKRANCPFFLT